MDYGGDLPHKPEDSPVTRSSISYTYFVLRNNFDMKKLTWSSLPMSLPPKNESLAERLNSSKESQEDEQDETSALDA